MGNLKKTTGWITLNIKQNLSTDFDNDKGGARSQIWEVHKLSLGDDPSSLP